MSPWHVTHVEIAGRFELTVRFADGVEGRARIEPSALSGVFAALGNPAFFHRVFIDNGAVTWPDEIDLAPDAMHDDILACGEYVFA